MKKEKAKKNVLKQWWFWLIIAAVVALTLATTLDYTILSGIIRLGCAPRGISTPSDYEETLAKTDALYDEKYESTYENAVMDVYTDGSGEKRPLLVYIHGGYFIGGDKKSAEPYCRTIAKEGFTVANVNYALAPENKYPSQVRQINEVVAFLVKNAEKYKIDTQNIFFSGDSAGCQIASQMGAVYTDESMAKKVNIEPAIKASQVKGLVLVCGLFNMKTVRATHFPFVNTAMWALTDVRNYESYYRIDELSTVTSATKDYPSSLIICGSDDPFYSQSEELRDALTELKVDVETYLPKSTNKKLKHEFARDFSLDEAYVAMDKAIEFMKARVTGKTQTKHTYVNFTLSTGDVLKVELYSKYAPKTVENFLKYAEDGFYDGTIFHRMNTGEFIQGGSFGFEYDNPVAKAATYPAIKGEFADNGYENNTLHHTRGTISMARTSDYNSATSGFFICDCDINGFDGQYAAFGEVVNEEGLEALDNLVNMPCVGETPLEYVSIVSVSVEKQ